MIPRRLLPALTAALTKVPAAALLGPRQVGKTTLALEVAESHPAIYLNLESEADRARLAEPELYLSQQRRACAGAAVRGACRGVSRFGFLEREWSTVFDPAARDKAAVHADPRAAGFYARRTLEPAVNLPARTTRP